MSRYSEQIDEHILAAFLTGDLPPSLRREIAAYIAHSERARDLISMATDALDVVESGDGAPRIALRKGRKRPTNISLSSAESADHDTRLWKVAALFAISVLVLAITVGLLAYEYTSNKSQAVHQHWSPSIGADQLSLRWPAQPDAVLYQVMVQNQRSGVSALVTRTEALSYEVPSNPIAFQSDTPYQIWVLALDAEQHVLSRSEAISVIE